MRKETIYGREVCLQGSPLTLLVFKNEFRGDPDAHDGNFGAQLSDLIKSEEQDGETVYFVNYLGLLRVAWALAKTYDKTVPDFASWLAEFPADKFSLVEGGEELSSVIDSVLADEIFRS